MSAVDIKGVKNRVLYLLETNEHLRDSDEKLIANVWFADLKELQANANEISAFEFLSLLAKGKLTNCQSIHRARRDIQRSIPELKGEGDSARHKKEEEIRDEFRKQG